MSVRIAAFAALLLTACSPSGSADPEAQALERWTLETAEIFPADKTLARAEDGVILEDGRLIVADQRYGLVEVGADGKHRPFGNFAAAGYVDDPKGKRAGPNGVHLTPDGKAIITADVYTGAIYRTDVASGTTTLAYQHDATVNTAMEDSTGALWFTQSTAGIGEAGMLAAIDRPKRDGALLRLTRNPDGTYAEEPEVLVDGLDFANGFYLDEGLGRLYLAETLANRVLSFSVDLAKGTVSDRKVLAQVSTPDNMRLDADGMLWIASPIANRVMVVDPATGSTRIGFDAQRAGNAKLIDEWNRRGAAGEARLDMMGPQTSGDMPGLVTGIVMNREGRPAYISNLGNALVKLERK